MPLPLLRLPEKLTGDVLRTFGIRELIAISILSKRAGNAVKLLKLSALDVNLYISNSIKFELIFEDPAQNLVLEFFKNTKRQNIALKIPKKVTLTSDGYQIGVWRFTSSKMSMEDWYMHIAYTFCPLLYIYFESGFTIFNIKSIKTSFKRFQLHILSIAENIPKNQSKMILKEFLLISNCLHLKRNPFRNEEDLRAIFIQNLDVYYGDWQRPTDFTLDDILMCNMAYLNIILPTWTDREINRFLKLWRKGACPRLCELAFYYDPDDWRWNQEEVLKGTNYQEFIGDREIQADGGYIMHVAGGYDIRGKDGRMCTIEIVESEFVTLYFYFYG